jgi:hypothetical protein
MVSSPTVATALSRLLPQPVARRKKMSVNTLVRRVKRRDPLMSAVLLW